MKRYWVFGGAACYPTGGWEDMLFQTDSLAEAVNSFTLVVPERYPGYWDCSKPLPPGTDIDWWNVFDSHTLQYVARDRREPLDP